MGYGGYGRGYGGVSCSFCNVFVIFNVAHSLMFIFLFSFLLLLVWSKYSTYTTKLNDLKKNTLTHHSSGIFTMFYFDRDTA